MGKTLQTIATMLDNCPLLHHSKPGAKHPPLSPDFQRRTHEETLWTTAKVDWKHEMAIHNVPQKLLAKKNSPARAGTLVVCPLIALSQWKSEIENFTAPNTLSVGIYHGPNRTRAMPAELIRTYDVVLTTYQVLEQDFRKMVSPNKVTCPNCNGKFKVDKLSVHLKYFCGEGAKRTEAQSRQRRSAENSNNRQRVRPPSSKQTKDLKKKPPMTKTAEPKNKKSSVKRAKGFDSESDLSVAEIIGTRFLGSRPTRNAAQTATKMMSSSVKEWGADAPVRKIIESDESSGASWMDSGSSEGDDQNSSEDERAQNLKHRQVRSSNESVAERARLKQANALKSVQRKGKEPKKVRTSKMSPPSKKLAKGKKKKMDDESSSTDGGDAGGDDPMEGIDLDALMTEAMEGSKASPLHSFCWWRVVLDEAHFIKSRSSQTAAAAFALTSIHRWCLSGTPLQNRVGELYSLIR